MSFAGQVCSKIGEEQIITEIVEKEEETLSALEKLLKYMNDNKKKNQNSVN